MTAPPAIHDLREAVARLVNPFGFRLGAPDYYGPDLETLFCSASQRVAFKIADAILAGPIASEHARLTEERDAAREDHIKAEAHICALEVLAYIDPEHTWKDAAIKERVARLSAEAELTTLKAAAARDAKVIARMREALVRIRDFAGSSILVRNDALDIVHQYAASAILTSPENADA